MSDPTQPSKQQVADALRMIADLHMSGIGVPARDDRRPWYRRELLAFFGISGRAASVILNGMTDPDVHDVPSTAGDHVLRDVYGKVLTTWVRVSYMLPAVRPAWATEPTEPTAPVRPAAPEPRSLLAALAAMFQPTPYAARHREAEATA